MGIFQLQTTVPSMAIRDFKRFPMFMRDLFKGSAWGLAALLSLAGSVCHAATRQDVNTQIQGLRTSIEELKVRVNENREQSVQVASIINNLIAQPQSIVVGHVTGFAGQSVHLPIFFKQGQEGIAGLQFDLDLGSDLTVICSEGTAATLSGKDIQCSSVVGTMRALVFGVNQTAIPTGVLAVLEIDIPDGSASGRKEVKISNITGSSSTGDAVPLTGVNGSLLID